VQKKGRYSHLAMIYAYQVHSLFGDHMVLQRRTRIPIWGTAPANSIITVKLNRKSYGTIAQGNGHWVAILDEMEAGGPYEVDISCGNSTQTFYDVYVGEVWICSGQSNMDQRVAKGSLHWCGVRNEEEEIERAQYPLIRLYSTRICLSETACSEPATAMTELTNPYTPGYSGSWAVCSPSTVGSFSATAYFFGRELFRSNKVPIGLIVSCYGSSTAEAWISREALENTPQLVCFLDNYHRRCFEYDSGIAKTSYKNALQAWFKVAGGSEGHTEAISKGLLPRPMPPHNPRLDQHSPTLLYNGMIAPLVPYATRGIVWYHGDSNGITADKYYMLLKALIEDWRSRWARDLTMLIVQCANIRELDPSPIGKGSFPVLREAQLSASRLPNVGLAVTIDIGERDSHPRNKQEVGRRLSLLARNLVHGECVPCQGPTYDGMKIEGSKIRLCFRHADGLTSTGPLGAFAIAGIDGNFVRAQATIDRETVVVYSGAILDPVSVRYAWSNHPIATLVNKHGLPASPFRTDHE